MKRSATAVLTSVLIALAAHASAGDRETKAPEDIFSGTPESPDALRKQLAGYGDAWSTQNLRHFPEHNASDCPGQNPESPSHTLYVRYVTDYPSNPQGRPTLLYTDIEIPAPGGGAFQHSSPNITEKVIRDDFEWKRTYETRWWTGTDQEWREMMEAERDRLEVQFMQAQDSSPMEVVVLSQKIAKIQMDLMQGSVQKLNRTVNDIVEVEAPPSAWSFKYDNHTKRGDPLYRREARLSASAAAGWMGPLFSGALEPVQRFANAVDEGATRTILGYSCQVKRARDWDAEACMTQISGASVALWTRIGRSESTVVHIDPAPCVPEAFFAPPQDVAFDTDE